MRINLLAYVPRLLAALILIGLLTGGVAAARPVSQSLDMVAGSLDGTFSVHLPAGWVFRSMSGNQVYSRIFLFANDQETLTASANSLLTGMGYSQPGIYGILTVVSPQIWGFLATTAESAAPELLDTALMALQVHAQFQITMEGGYAAYIAEVTDIGTNSRGYLGAFVADGQVILFTLAATPAQDFETYRLLLEEIGDTIRVPAEPGALTSPPAPTPAPTREFAATQEAVATDEPPIVSEATPTPTTEGETPAEIVLLPAAEGRLSIEVPGDWWFIDHAATQHAFAYGDSIEAASSRLYAVRPDLLDAPVATTGTGGVIVLYPMSQFGVDPANPELSGLMDQVLGGLEAAGYEIIQRSIDNTIDAQIALVRGSEYGYLALIPFGDEIAYVTATGTPDTFEANDQRLYSILLSVSVPAATPTPEPTGLPGLGGLGGLTGGPTPTPAGLGGLGILGATGTPLPEPAATEEAGAS